jgi:hypothetical protein
MGDFSPEKLFLFILFALPGAVAIRVYALWFPTPVKDWKESVFDAVTYSTIVFAVWYVFFPSAVKDFVTAVVEAQKHGADEPTKTIDTFFGKLFSLVLYVLVTPFLLTLVWSFCRQRFFHRFLGFDHPIRTAWDWVFSRKQALYIFFYLKQKNADGSRFVRVGYFNGNSYVTSYPFDAEIYVERVHQLKPDGTVGQPIPGSGGMLIRLSECEFLEFLLDPTPVKLKVSERVTNWVIGTPGLFWSGCCRVYGYTRKRIGGSRWRTSRVKAVEQNPPAP